MKKVTIQDVAKELNLSRNTVARALNNSDTVAYETRYLVIKRACELGYLKLAPAVLNEFKLKTSMNDYKTIVVLARRELCAFWNSIIMGISDEVNKNGCKLRLNFISDEDEENLTLPLDFTENVDAILFIGVFTNKYTDMILKMKLPTVFLDQPANGLGGFGYNDVIVCEGKNSIRMIMEHLTSQGMKKIGFIGDVTYCESIKQRYEGFLDGMRLADLSVDPDIVTVSHKADRYYKIEEVEETISAFPYIPEAIVCANDDIALYVIRCLRKRGYRIPEDVAVTGFDNIEGLTQVESILTTVAVRNQKVGKRLVQQLLWRMENPDFPREIISIETQPIIRMSSIRNLENLG
ncbi:MAG TPA: LacI family transcriptional regulator [Lachnoclostridium phytofermentans]|uniref:LacI family transcriptional regulator n=1 Tax=Lachnoclostridium phytofermentans TaxID=66219 RepID=A0A3D2X3H1_9FIRM|nr:LacI family DNA-binding transcriptional regulator [Lachnoclostridium sp.]HCL01652.1 LacI family transcriptional regulator [Lachnoclostridium phytofermentans]